jgi:hypothetical protein
MKKLPRTFSGHSIFNQKSYPVPFVTAIIALIACAPFPVYADSTGSEPLLLGETYERSGQVRADLKGLGITSPQPPTPPTPPQVSSPTIPTESFKGASGAVRELVPEGQQHQDLPPFIPGETIKRGGRSMRVWSTSGSVGGSEPAKEIAPLPPVIVDYTR